MVYKEGRMIMDNKPEGFYIPIHKSLITPILIGGIPKNLCLCIWSIGIAIGVMMKMYWFFIVVIGVHITVRRMTKQDPQFFATVISHLHDKRYFDV